MGFVIKTADPEQKINFAEWGITPSNYETPREEELRHLYHASFKQAEEGNIVTGRVVAIQPQHVVVDVGLKSEGVIPREEFGPDEEIRVGQTIDVLLVQREDRDGTIQLSKVQADKQRAWQQMLHACESDGRVKGKVTRKVKGGLMVSIGGIDAFLPSSQIALQNVKNVDEYLGQEIEVKVIKVNHERQNVVVSRRELLDQERMERKRDFLEKIKVGDIRRGVVKNITDFGAFIDLHGIDGLLHLTDMKWGRINHPSEMLQLGQPVDVMIIGIDYEKERVALGIKQMYDNPWLDVESKYPVNSTVRGKVVNILPYGAFVELEEGVEGLIHISEFSWTRKVNHPSEFVKLGDEVTAVVLNVDPYDQKISLGMRQTQPNPWDTVEERYPVGSKVRGIVRNLTTYGAFVELEEGIDGLIHVSDMSWTRKINHPSEMLKKNDEVEAVVLNVNAAERKIALGLKQLTPDPWEHIHDLYKEGDIVTGKITNTTSFGAFIQLQHDIEGLIHISELADRQVGSVRDVVKVGDEVTGKIVRVEPGERKIAVSIRAYERDKAMEAQRAAQESAGATETAAPPPEPKRFESGIDISVASGDLASTETRTEPPTT
ncbi:MAG: 30S ribosomal protein S1 [bacterium]|nr:30S ribosomal protein S1 [bacterium]